MFYRKKKVGFVSYYLPANCGQTLESVAVNQQFLLAIFQGSAMMPQKKKNKSPLLAFFYTQIVW